MKWAITSKKETKLRALKKLKILKKVGRLTKYTDEYKVLRQEKGYTFIIISDFSLFF